MGWQVESHAASSTASWVDFASPGKGKAHLAECRGVETEGRGARGGSSCAVPCLVVLWAGGEWASDNDMAVMSCKWALEGAVGGRAHIFSLALPVGRSFKPSISPTSSTRSQVMKSAVLLGAQLLILSTSNSFVIATIDLSHVQFWRPPLNPTSSKCRASPHTCKNGRSSPTTSSRVQLASLHNRANEILGRDKQPKSAVAPTQYQGRDSAFQQEGDVVGAQGAMRENPRDERG
jgi:hypothetical protein